MTSLSKVSTRCVNVRVFKLGERIKQNVNMFWFNYLVLDYANSLTDVSDMANLFIEIGSRCCRRKQLLRISTVSSIFTKEK